MTLKEFARQLDIPNDLDFDRAAENMVPHRTSKVQSRNSGLNGEIHNLARPGRIALRI